MKGLVFIASLAAVFLVGCSDGNSVHVHLTEPKTKLIYFGFDDQSEKPADVVRLADIWGGNKVCPHWRPTVSEKDADYKVLFGVADVTIIGHRGEILYTGGQGPLYLPHGNPD